MAKVWPFTIIALIIIMVLGWYFYAHQGKGVLVLTTTVPKTTAGSTTVGPSSTVNAGSTIMYINSCDNAELINYTTYGLDTIYCSWSGGQLGLWGAAGNASSEQIIVTGVKDGKTYVNLTEGYNCTTFLESFFAPEQTYNFTLITGAGGGQCGPTVAKLNTTIKPPNVPYYNFVFNGNFEANYTGWNSTGEGFGTHPLNLTHANENYNCYIGRPWSGYNGSFVATTFDCGLGNSPGNLTSQPFKVTNKPYLNFKLVSPQDNYLYVEIIYSNDTPAIIAHYNTFNSSTGGGESASTFANVTLPMITLINQVVRIRIVADTLTQHNYIAAGDFQLSSQPLQSKGVVSNVSIT
jgi:hypothetical protein